MGGGTTTSATKNIASLTAGGQNGIKQSHTLAALNFPEKCTCTHVTLLNLIVSSDTLSSQQQQHSGLEDKRATFCACQCMYYSVAASLPLSEQLLKSSSEDQDKDVVSPNNSGNTGMPTRAYMASLFGSALDPLNVRTPPKIPGKNFSIVRLRGMSIHSIYCSFTRYNYALLSMY